MTRMIRFLIFTVACLVMLGFGSAAQAQCPDFGVPLNLSYEVDAAEIEEQILAGCDPHIAEGDNDWSAQGGTRRGSPGSSGASLITNVSKARMDCPPTRKEDSTCETEYPECTGRPGGLSVGGADSVCEKGAGTPTVGLLGILDGLFPGFLDGFIECLWKFLSGMDFSSFGGFIGSFVNNVTVSANADFSRDGLCVGGSVGFCGMSVGGEICVLNELGEAVAAAQTGVSFVETFAPADIFFGMGTEFTHGPVVLVDGGYLEGYGDIPAGSVLASIYDNENSDGEFTEMGLYIFPEGTTQADILSGEVRGEKIADLTEYMDADPEGGDGLTLSINGLARIPVENVQLLVDDPYDDSERLVDASRFYIPPPVIPEGQMDTDGDGWADAYDLNGDGIPDYDIDGDGIPDAPGPYVDIDGDGRPDLDFNGDGVPDSLVDTDGDGLGDAPDINDDGLVDRDINSDGVPDVDLNSDGFPETDIDGDGVYDVDLNRDGRKDVDLTGDGIADAVDLNGDNIADFDVNGDGRPDAYTGTLRITQYIDLNGDGILDAADINRDGRPDYDTNGDGIPDPS